MTPITTEVKQFFTTHDTTQIITTIMSVTVRDASINPGLYKSTDTGDELTDLARLISKLGSLSKDDDSVSDCDLLSALHDSFLTLANKRLDVENRLAAQVIFEAYKTGIIELLKAINDLKNPIDFSIIINNVNEKLK